MLQRKIPVSGEELPVIGLGTWQAFDVSASSYAPLISVLQQLHKAGGILIDSSPMYGRSEKVIGDITCSMTEADHFFYATKVWTTGKEQGIMQMADSFKKMQRTTMDLVQVHNLVDHSIHLPVLREWKEEGKIRYTGITHYTDASHEALITVMKKEKPDFVQFNYSILNRDAEKNVLPAAQDLGIATIINRPLGQGELFNKVKNKQLPPWAIDAGMQTWGAFFLKYILSHAGVNVVIPATANPAHAADNLSAGEGPLPDAALRKKMLSFIEGAW